MKLTWTFYPKFSERITLTVIYVPKIDNTGHWGFLHQESNTCWVRWDCFQVFNRGELAAKKDAFGRLVAIEGSFDTNSLTALLAQ